MFRRNAVANASARNTMHAYVFGVVYLDGREVTLRDVHMWDKCKRNCKLSERKRKVSFFLRSAFIFSIFTRTCPWFCVACHCFNKGLVSPHITFTMWSKCCVDEPPNSWNQHCEENTYVSNFWWHFQEDVIGRKRDPKFYDPVEIFSMYRAWDKEKILSPR